MTVANYRIPDTARGRYSDPSTLLARQKKRTTSGNARRRPSFFTRSMSERLINRSTFGNLAALIRNGEPLAALRPASLQHCTAIRSGHSSTKAMLVGAPAAGGLIRSLHQILSYL